MEAREHWIFYLKLTKNLTRDFISLDAEFKQHNKTLIPIGLRSLLECTRKRKSIHVLIVIRSYREYRYYHKKVKKLMKYMMRTDKVHLYFASSFQLAHDPSILKRNHYEFVSLPVHMEKFCTRISELVDIKEQRFNSWPGGVRPRLSLAG